MKVRYLLIGIVLVVLIVIGLVAAAVAGRPELVSLLPSDGEVGVSATSRIRMEFSRLMDHESVTSRLKFEPAVQGSFSWEQNILSFLPDSSLPGGQELKLALEPGARAASWLAFPMGGESWRFTTSETYLAYLWPSNAPADIYALNPVTGEILQYTKERGVFEFSADRDGMMLFFSASNNLGGADLYQLDRKAFTNAAAEPYMPKKLVDCGVAQCRSPVVSYNSKYLAYEYLLPDPQGLLGPASVRLVRFEGFAEISLSLEAHETIQPQWSSTGWLVYYDRTREGYAVVNPETEQRVELPNQTGQPGSWSPDGGFYLAPEIFYHPASASGEIGTSHLLRYNIQTGTSEELSEGNDVEDVEGSYSPGGESIAFARKYLNEDQWTFGRQLWIMNSDGSGSHPISDEANYNHYDIAWSRDGLRLAYVRFNQVKLSDPPELWMVDGDGNNPVQLVIGGYSPIWIP